MSVLASTDQGGRAVARVRTRKPGPVSVVMPKAEKGKYFVALRRGQTYHLTNMTKADLIFTRGQIVEVTEQVYNHLATNAVDVTGYVDPELGRVRRLKRKFQHSPELPEDLSVEYVDLPDAAA